MMKVPLFLRIDSESSQPLHAQVYRGLRDAIGDGRLAPGAYLPSSRSLASELRLGRNTVLRALARLEAEGLVESRVGAGIRVIPGAAARAASATPPRAQRKTGRTISETRGGEWTGRREPRPFRPGTPPFDVFPHRIWARLSARRWRESGTHLVEPSGALGYSPLREVVTDYLRSARGVTCDADHVIITSGAQHSFEIAVRAVFSPGDSVWVEEIGRPDVRRVLDGAHVRPLPVVVDRHGFDPANAQALGAAHGAIVTPSCHLPSGTTLSMDRREQVVAMIRAAGAWLIEDDHYGVMRFVGRPAPTLYAIEGGTKTLFVGSFANTVFPGLPIGFLVVPDALLDRVAAARSMSEQHAPTATQAILADFISEGHFARHLRRLRSVTAERYSATVQALAHHCGGLLTPWPADAGVHIIGWLASGLTETGASAAAERAQVDVGRLESFRYGAGAAGLVLCYGGWPPKELRAGAERLGRALGRATFFAGR